MLRNVGDENDTQFSKASPHIHYGSVPGLSW